MLTFLLFYLIWRKKRTPWQNKTHWKHFFLLVQATRHFWWSERSFSFFFLVTLLVFQILFDFFWRGFSVVQQSTTVRPRAESRRIPIQLTGNDDRVCVCVLVCVCVCPFVHNGARSRRKRNKKTRVDIAVIKDRRPPNYRAGRLTTSHSLSPVFRCFDFLFVSIRSSPWPFLFGCCWCGCCCCCSSSSCRLLFFVVFLPSTSTFNPHLRSRKEKKNKNETTSLLIFFSFLLFFFFGAARMLLIFLMRAGTAPVPDDREAVAVQLPIHYCH